MIRIRFLSVLLWTAALAAVGSATRAVPANAEEEQQNETAAPAAEVATPSAGEETHDQRKSSAHAMRDPFQPPSALSGEADDLLAVEVSEIPPGIRVVGIARVEGRPATAIIAVPGCQEPILVREHDVVRLEVAASETAPPSMAPQPETTAPPHLQRAHPGARPPTAESHAPSSVTITLRQKVRILYLYISKIDNLTVEAYPRARPDDKQIFR